jgi:hypothetical protein
MHNCSAYIYIKLKKKLKIAVERKLAVGWIQNGPESFRGEVREQ